MTDPFISQICTYIDEQSLIPKDCLVIAGFSGGADSLAMMIALAACRDIFSFKLVAAHLNHGLRGQEADEDEAFVRAWCHHLAVDCHVERLNVKQYASEHKMGLEEAGRLCRQQLFSRIASAHKQTQIRIALAHHQQDQAETMLLHLGRGCGLDGLVGIRPQSDRLIRPLLTQSRSAIEDFLKSQQIIWREDSTNQSDFALRNRIRHQLIPAWQQLLGYDPVPNLARAAELVASDRKLLFDLLDPLYQAIYADQTLHYAQLLSYEKTATAHLLRRFWREMTDSEPDLGQVHLDSIMTWLPNAVTGQQIDLPGRWSLFLDKPYLLLRKKDNDKNNNASVSHGKPSSVSEQITEKENDSEHEYPLQIPGLTDVPDLNLMIEAVLIENEGQIVYNNAMECFRHEDIQQVVLRFRRPGDRIYPLTGGGGKSLKKYFNEQKVKPYKRARIPLLAVGRHVVWIPGLMADERYAVRPGQGYKGGIVCIKIHQQCSGKKPDVVLK